MESLHYRDSELYIDDIPLRTIAEQFGTPTYVYSKKLLEQNWKNFDQSFNGYPHRICYAVKANSNIHILKVLADLKSGFDIVSLGELERVMAAGGDPANIIFSGVGKKSEEIERALEVGIACFNVESEAELHRIRAIAKQKNKIAPISLRINPDIDAKTHPYIATGLSENKFGIEYKNALQLTLNASQLSHIKLIGIACHIGSQLTELDPFIEAMDKILHFIDTLKSHHIHVTQINIGGGLGVKYQDEVLPTIQDYIHALQKKCAHSNLTLIIEPGRAIVANAGLLLTRVEFLKHHHEKNFAIVDAAMNDLIRPALYEAWHNILPLSLNESDKKTYDIVGPVCESGDFLGKNRLLSLNEGDLLAILSAGAYGFSMSSNYNSRPRAAEVMLDHNQLKLIRRRETIQDLINLEQNN